MQWPVVTSFPYIKSTLARFLSWQLRSYEQPLKAEFVYYQFYKTIPVNNWLNLIYKINIFQLLPPVEKHSFPLEFEKQVEWQVYEWWPD